MTDVSIVMPCLDERASLGHCIANAREALDQLAHRYGLVGEIVIADNGSTDGSQDIAEALGARVVAVAQRGYGAALRGGFAAARGRYLVMGDADGSYDFRDAVSMVAALVEGADICMGSRFKGGIAPGAMPWKNRYIGNPILTGVLNLFFGSGVSDAHCGLRALTRRSLTRLHLTGDGMEFASEMLVKAALMGLTIAEVPATLSPDLRGRPPHLRPWRDGWRHLRFLLLMSPAWLFAVPAGVLLSLGLLLLSAPLTAPLVALDPLMFGTTWTILGGALVTLGYQCLLFGGVALLAGIRAGWRRPGRFLRGLAPIVSVDGVLIAGVATTLTGCASLAMVFAYWTMNNLEPLGHVWPAVLGTTLASVGVSTMFGGFLFGIIGGNEPRFLAPALPRDETSTLASPTRHAA